MGTMSASMETKTQLQTVGADLGGALTVPTGRPLLAGPVPKGFERVFEPFEGRIAPEFCKLPPPRGRCPFTGASRTWLLEHAEAGHFKIVRVRKPGAVRGAVFIHVPSLLEFLRKEMEKEQS